MRVRHPYAARACTSSLSAHFLGDVCRELLDHVTQPVDLRLACNMRGHAARVLNVLLAVQDLPHCLRRRPDGVPHMHGKHERVAPRIVVKDGFGRRIGKDAAVPIMLAIDAHGRKRRRERARSQHMLDVDLGLEAIEIAHLARLDVRGADRQTWLVALAERKVDELQQRALKRCGRVIAGVVGAERDVGAKERKGVRREEAGQTSRNGGPVCESLGDLRRPERPRSIGGRRAARTPPRQRACLPGSLPTMIEALMAPMEVPMTQSGSMPASCSA